MSHTYPGINSERAFNLMKVAISIRIRRAFVRAACASWPLLWFCLAPSAAHSSDIVLIRPAEAPSSEQDAMELASQFYGLDLKTIVLRGKSEIAGLGIVAQKSTLAVAVEANALAVIDRNALLKALHRSTGEAVPLLIL